MYNFDVNCETNQKGLYVLKSVLNSRDYSKSFQYFCSFGNNCGDIIFLW